MAGYRKRVKNLKNYLMAMSVFVLTVAMCMILFFVMAQRTIDKNSKEMMANNVSRQSEHLQMILNIHYGYLEGIAAEMGEDGELLSDENMELLKELQESTDMERLALIEPNGDSHYEDGTVKNVAHRRYFQEGIAGQRTLSDPLESSIDQETRVVLGVPVCAENGEVLGVLGGSYNVGVLAHMLFDDLFGGRGYSLIVTKEGYIIAHDGDATYQKLTYGDNILEFYRDKKVEGNYTFRDIKNDFDTGKDGIIRMGGYEDNADRYFSYAPLGINDWMICYVTPVFVAQQAYDFVEQYEMIFLGCFLLLVFILIIYIMHQNRRKTQEILRAAQMDELTQVYNRKYTEERIKEVLKDSEDYTKQAFFIIDIDKFKEVNDTYGHAVGDAVLTAFGKTLRKQFRENDIVGRIGGDEFVVLMCRITSREVAEGKAIQLLEEAKKLYFPQMGDTGITISIGIAFAPEDGVKYSSLYQSADRALYETKRVGRNGFTMTEAKS